MKSKKKEIKNTFSRALRFPLDGLNSQKVPLAKKFRQIDVVLFPVCICILFSLNSTVCVYRDAIYCSISLCMPDFPRDPACCHWCCA